MSLDRLSSFALPPPGQAHSSGTSSPRQSSIASHNGSQSSFTSASSSSSNGPKTPSPTLPITAVVAPTTSIVRYDAMNHAPDMYYSQHLSAGQPPTPQTVTSGAMAHYHQQPPPSMLQSTHAQYSNPAPYSYGYANGLTSPPAAPPSVSNGMATQNVLPLPGGVTNQNSMTQPPQYNFDTSGQQPPPGMKPRVTATLWEDEGSLCFQVEARGICVARREDNHMINGTKLLNVAGMTRGRRDGILKSEKIRHVVKIGPMHLKGVWIPYDRALEFANKEKITELLYPLFVHNIGSLLYHPTNQNRTTQVMAAAERRKQDQGQLRAPSSHGLPSIHQQQSAMAQVPPPQPTLPSHSSLGRPGLERAHTFPTPPTSASSVINGMGASEGFNWQAQSINGQQATTPPGTSLQSLQPYPTNAHAYDSQRQMYSAQSTQQSPYQATTNSQDRLYGQTGSYPPTNDIAPRLPSRQATSRLLFADRSQAKANAVLPSDQPASQQAPDDEADHEQDPEYTHDSGSYDASRTAYNYNTQGALPSDSGSMGPDLSASPNHPPASGRATPRTTAQSQSYYQHTGYNTPPRVQQSSSLYNVMSNERPATNSAAGTDVYAPTGELSGSMTNGYASRPPALNGTTVGGAKRGRDDDETANNSGLDLKRRKTIVETSIPAPVYDAMSQSTSTVGAPRR